LVGSVLNDGINDDIIISGVATQILNITTEKV